MAIGAEGTAFAIGTARDGRAMMVQSKDAVSKALQTLQQTRQMLEQIARECELDGTDDRILSASHRVADAIADLTHFQSQM